MKDNRSVIGFQVLTTKKRELQHIVVDRGMLLSDLMRELVDKFLEEHRAEKIVAMQGKDPEEAADVH